MTATRELPSDPVLDSVLACVDPASMLAACSEQLSAVDSVVRRSWRQARIIEALYHPGRYVRVAYAFLTDSSIPDHRVWPRGDIVYVHAPVRSPMSRRGIILRLGDAEVEVYRFPNDRRLRGLRKFVSQEPAVTIWQKWMDQDGAGERIDPKTLQRFLLRYVPEQKWIARLRAETIQQASRKVHKRRIVIRSASPPLCATLLARFAALRRFSKESKTPFHAVRVVGHDARLGLLGVKWAQGRSLFEVLQEEPTKDVLHKVVTVIRSFHTSSVPDLPRITLPGLLSWGQDAVDDLSSACPDLRDSIVQVGATLKRRLSEIDGCPLVTLHNDLHWNQIRVDGDRFTLLDLERMAVGDPLIDVANLATQLRMLGHRPEFPVDPVTTQRWTEEFIRQWEHLSQERVDAVRFRCYAVLSLLSLARGMMRHLRQGWRPLAIKCIDLAETELSATSREVIVP